MATRTWQFLINTFLVNTANNFKKTLTLITDHLSKLESQISDAEILAIFNSFQPLKESFENLYSQWQQTLGTYEGKTQSFTERLQHFSYVQINVWRGKVHNIYPENSADAKEIFYDDRKPFQTGTYEQRVLAFKTLGDKLAEYADPVLTALSVEVLSAHNELKALRDAQQNKEGASAIFSDALENARVTVCVAMYGNLGLLMHKYRETPETTADYFDLSLIRRTGNGDDNEDEGTVFEGTVNMGMPVYIDTGDETLTETSELTLQNPGLATLSYFVADNINSMPGPGLQSFNVIPGGEVVITGLQAGVSPTRNKLHVSTAGPGAGAYKTIITF